eukprot:1136908-Pelagomonas_calceolata.AAC.10
MALSESIAFTLKHACLHAHSHSPFESQGEMLYLQKHTHLHAHSHGPFENYGEMLYAEGLEAAAVKNSKVSVVHMRGWVCTSTDAFGVGQYVCFCSLLMGQ